MAFLELKNLAIGYTTVLIENINLSVEKGSLIAIIGSNGSGKSTLLKTIANILKPLKGKIFIENKNISSFSFEDFSHICGFSPSQPPNSQYLRVIDLVSLGRLPYLSNFGFLSQHDIEIINEALILTDSYENKNKFLNRLSDGQRQKANIARLLAQQTQILLFDEPTAFLDINTKIKILHIFRKIAHQKSKIIIFSTHDINLAIDFADYIWLISNKAILSNTPEDHILQGNFSNVFDTKDIYFDNFYANFAFKAQPNFCVSMKFSDNNLRNFWTKKALQRLNAKIVDDSDLVVIVGNENWQIIFNNEKYEADTIQKLLAVISSFVAPNVDESEFTKT